MAKKKTVEEKEAPMAEAVEAPAPAPEVKAEEPAKVEEPPKPAEPVKVLKWAFPRTFEPPTARVLASLRQKLKNKRWALLPPEERNELEEAEYVPGKPGEPPMGLKTCVGPCEDPLCPYCAYCKHKGVKAIAVAAK